MILSTATKEELVKILAPIVLAHCYDQGWSNETFVKELKSLVYKIYFSFLENDES
jgi:phenolic acid decarboxylase